MGRGHVAGSDWSEEDLAYVEKLWKEGWSAGQISGEIPRTRNAILGMMARHRERFPKKTKPGKRPGGWPKGGTAVAKGAGWTPAMTGTAARMWGDGASAKEIGIAIGRSEASVRARASQLRDLFPARMKLRALAKVAAPVARQEPASALPAEPAIEPILALDSRPVTLMERRVNQCCFPLWENYGAKPTAESLYCGGAVQGDGDYCGFHHRVVYQPRVVVEQPQRRRAA